MTVIEPENRLKTAYGEFYSKLTEGKDKSFSGKTELFVVALTLGYINAKKSQTYASSASSFVRYSTLFDEKRQDLRSICELVYSTFAKGENSKEKWDDFCKIADGGIEILQEHYEKNGERIEQSNLFEESKELAPARIKQIMSEIE